MSDKPKPRYDFGGDFLIPQYEPLSENEVQDIFGNEYSTEQNNELIHAIYKLTELHLGYSIGLDLKNMPTTG